MKFAVLALLGVVSAQQIPVSDVQEDLDITVDKKFQQGMGGHLQNIGQNMERLITPNDAMKKKLNANPGKCPLELEELIDPAIRWALSPEALRADGTEKFAAATPEGQAVIKSELALGRFIEAHPPRPIEDGIHFDNKDLPGYEQHIGDFVQKGEAYNRKHLDEVMGAKMKTLQNKEFATLTQAMKKKFDDNFIYNEKMEPVVGKAFDDMGKYVEGNLEKSIKVTDAPKGWKPPCQRLRRRRGEGKPEDQAAELEELANYLDML